jgi:D-serine deaminase-like pyridoxal phosphate-dependent protein
MQTEIGSCDISQISVALACPVVAKYPERKEVVVHGGAVHFSKDFIKDNNGTTHYGKVAVQRNGWWAPEETGMFVKSLSQEHGIIHAEKDDLESIEIGDVLPILPVHSCLTADAMKSYTLKDGRILSMMS